MRRLSLTILIFGLMVTNSFAAVTIDPLDIGVGTRALGMGRAFVGMADDTNSIFLNPAGLASANNWGMSSMYTSLLSEVTFNTIGYHRSLSSEGFGVGFAGASMGGNIVTATIDPITHRIIPGGTISVGYNSNVFLLSYGVLLSKYFNLPYSERTSAGVSFKVFSQSIRAVDETFATGLDMDVGIIYDVNPWLKAGFSGQNVLPSSLGGSLKWNSGEWENIPSSFKLGLSAKALGKDAYWEYPQTLYYNFEFEGSPIVDRPYTYHTGVEWWPYDFLAIRGGIDQDIYSKGTGNGVDNNLTFGVGLWRGDFGFDYAYHQYGPLTENITHYFSLTYGLPASKPTPAPEAIKPEEVKAEKKAVAGEYLNIIEPFDMSLIYSNLVLVSGEVLNEKVAEVRVNNNEISISKEGGKVKFHVIVGVGSFGKSIVRITCFGEKNNLLKEYKIKIIRLPSFSDVPGNYWAKEKIGTLAMLDIFGGYPDGTFKPDEPINRAELISLLVRAKGFVAAEAVETGFKDVKRNYWASYFIKVGVEQGIVSGYPDKTFKPSNPVNKAEGVTIFSRFAGLKEPEMITKGPFPDVPGRHWAAKSITAAESAGLLMYLIDKPFEPNKEMTRAEAAEILSRTKLAKNKAAELFNWGTGFK